MARSDTDVWVIGSAHGTLEAWHYGGSGWTDHPPAKYSYAAIGAAALGSNGILYLAGNNGHTHRGIILSYDGSRWTDLSPANPPYDYKTLAVTTDGTLIAAGGGRGDGALQERSGATWTTVSLSAPVSTITRVGVAPGGTVYGVGSVSGNQQVLIEQPPGSRSAIVLDAPAAGQTTTFAPKNGVAALGLDVWLLGQDEPHFGWHHTWITHDDSGFVAVRRRMWASSAAPGSGRPCWPGAGPGSEVAIRSLPGSSRCGWASRAGNSGGTWPRRASSAPARSGVVDSPPSQAPPTRAANGLPAAQPEVRQAWLTPSPAAASRHRWGRSRAC